MHSRSQTLPVAAVVTCAFALCGPAHAQPAPAGKTAEQAFKNIQALQGTPADQVFPAMQFIAASLGVECDFCHVQGKFDSDDKPAKKTARKMIAMTLAINKDSFNSRKEVTCYSCHRGSHDPVGTPPVLTSDAEPEHAEAAPAAAVATPTADQILDKYVAAVGGAAGAGLLLGTPPGVFSRVVPFLVAAGSVVLLCEPRLTAWRQRREGPAHKLALAAGLVGLSLYNGYFGAGSGVMTLTLLLVLVDRRLPIANALKNMLIGAATVVSASVFALSGSVDWSAAAPLAAGMLAGSRVGPLVARRVAPDLLRRLIALLGMVLALELWLRPGL